MEEQRVVRNEDEEVGKGLLVKGLPRHVRKSRLYPNTGS